MFLPKTSHQAQRYPVICIILLAKLCLLSQLLALTKSPQTIWMVLSRLLTRWSAGEVIQIAREKVLRHSGLIECHRERSLAKQWHTQSSHRSPLALTLFLHLPTFPILAEVTKRAPRRKALRMQTSKVTHSPSNTLSSWNLNATRKVPFTRSHKILRTKSKCPKDSLPISPESCSSLQMLFEKELHHISH